MTIEINYIDNKKSLLSRRWKLCDFDERNAIYFSQKHNLKYIVSKLLSIRGVDKDYIENFLNPNINNFNTQWVLQKYFERQNQGPQFFLQNLII